MADETFVVRLDFLLCLFHWYLDPFVVAASAAATEVKMMAKTVGKIENLLCLSKKKKKIILLRQVKPTLLQLNADLTLGRIQF